jgi:hypothetical protein
VISPLTTDRPLLPAEGCNGVFRGLRTTSLKTVLDHRITAGQHFILTPWRAHRSWKAGLFHDQLVIRCHALSHTVACHHHGTALSGFLPASWDHLICQSWDHPARRAERFWIRSLTACVMTNDVEVNGDGFQGGQCGRGA